MSEQLPSDLRTAWSQRQVTYGNSPRAVLLKGMPPLINDLIDTWHREVMHSAFTGRDGASKTLDIGCGYGRLAGHAHSIGLQHIIGIDFAQEFCKQFQIDHGPAICGDLSKLPFTDASFANAYVVTALMYLSPSKAGLALHSLDRCLESEARILVLEPSAEFNKLARVLLRNKRHGNLTQPGFSLNTFDNELAPATWLRIAYGSNIGMTIALPLLLLVSRTPLAFNALARVVLWIDRPRSRPHRSFLARFALHRWIIFHKSK